MIGRVVLAARQSAKAMLAVGLLLPLAGYGAAADEPVLYDSHPLFVNEEAGMWCADASHPERLLGITNSEVGGNPNVANIFRTGDTVKVSRDAGGSWTTSLHIDQSGFDIDPACAFGVDRQAFVGAMAGDHGYNLWSSTDSGDTWGAPVYIDYPRMFDRPHIAVDRGNSRWRGRLYIVANGTSVGAQEFTPDEIVIYKSSDSGRTFDNPTRIALAVGVDDHKGDNVERGVVHLGQAIVLDDGALAVSWTEAYLGHGPDNWVCTAPDRERVTQTPCGTSAIKFAVSHDGGETFSSPVVVARGHYDIREGDQRRIVGKFYPTLALDRSSGPHHGRIYLAWSDTGEGRQQIRFTSSDSNGAKWQATKIISDDLVFDAAHPIEGPHNAMVTLAVNQEGIVGAMYYAQVRQAPGAEFWSTFTSSDDGGATWAATSRVTPAPLSLDRFKPAWNVGQDWQATLGRPSAGSIVMRFPNYASVPSCSYGLVASGNGSFKIFTLVNPRHIPEYMEITRFAASQAVVRHSGGGEIGVEVGAWDYRPKANIMEVSVSLRNLSQRELPLPIRLVATVEFKHGTTKFLNADNARTINGAWWDFGAVQGQSILRAGQVTVSRKLRIYFDGYGHGSEANLQSVKSLNFIAEPLVAGRASE